MDKTNRRDQSLKTIYRWHIDNEMMFKVISQEGLQIETTMRYHHVGMINRSLWAEA